MPSITVHQALHGYNDGHRLISSSLPLGGLEARLMLVMSDLSGPGVKPPPVGYLTGYPLDKAGKYVLARTWPAPQMPRPGCVWTHSLMIDNADLAQMTSVTSLFHAFYRPEGPTVRAAYTTSLRIETSGPPVIVSDIMRARLAIDGLYGYPDRRIVGEARDASGDEHLVMAIWLQQWPRLRRTFGFCTLAGADRSTKGVELDLQFAPSGDRLVQTKFPGAISLENIPPDRDLDVLVSDLLQPEGSQLREFLRRTGGDVDGGRRAMRPLCRLFESILLREHLDLSAAVSAFSLLESGGKKQARSLRSLVARQAIQTAEDVDEDVFDFLVETLESTVDERERLELGNRLGTALWRRSPERFHAALKADSVLGQVASHSLAELNQVEVIEGLRRHPDLAADLAWRRPEILFLADLWRIPKVRDDLVKHVPVADAGRLASALILAGRSGPARFVMQHADPLDLLSALNRAPVEEGSTSEWLSALARDPNKVARLLASGQVSQHAMLVAIARRISPDSVPNEYGDDPWLIALRSATGQIGQDDEDFLAAYILARALGGRSQSEAELLQFAYTRIYQALQQQRLSSDAKDLATGRLNWGTWFDWDTCSRLRGTVTHRFIDRHLDPGTFGRLTEDGHLAITLIDEAARSGRGRKYLNDVRKSLKGAKEKGIRARANYIAKRVK